MSFGIERLGAAVPKEVMQVGGQAHACWMISRDKPAEQKHFVQHEVARELAEAISVSIGNPRPSRVEVEERDGRYRVRLEDDWLAGLTGGFG